MIINKVTNLNRLNNLPLAKKKEANLNSDFPYFPKKSFVFSTNYQQNQVLSGKFINKIDKIKWIKDSVIKESLIKLGEVRFLPGDMQYIKDLGVNILFNNGEEAIDLLIKNKIQIKFAKIKSPQTHAQWINDKNLIIINEKYKDTKDKGIILAISEAIFHEIGHAKDKDKLSSIQEEIDCLALNTLANRCHLFYYPSAFFSGSKPDIIDDGVCLYTKLFFDTDQSKTALKKRILEKYGNLPLKSPNHPPLELAISLLKNIL